MQIDVILQQIGDTIGAYIPNLLGALAILIVGWIVALIIAAIVRRALKRAGIDRRLARPAGAAEAPAGIELSTWISRIIYYILLLVVLVAFFQTLGLTIVTEPLNQLLTQLFSGAPRLLGAAALILIAWLLATVLRALVSRALRTAGLDQRISDQAGIEDGEAVPLSKTLADATYWLVFLLFLPAVLDSLALQGLLQPVQGMVDSVLAFLPNILAAGLILVVGWFVARIVQRIVSNLLAAIGADRLSERIGLAQVLGKQKLSGVLGLIVYILILVPVLIGALNALALDAITQPASNMLNTILSALPAIFAAGLVLVIAYAVGRVVAGLVTNLLTGIGFNNILARLGVARQPLDGQRTASEIVGYLVLVAVMLFASIEAARVVGFVVLADLLTQFTIFAAQVIVGLIIFAIGLYVSNIAARAIRDSGASQSSLLALAARVSILVLAGAMALRQMGLASDIINLAFGLMLGAIAVATALAFGLGAREVAGREVEGWLRTIRSDNGSDRQRIMSAGPSSGHRDRSPS
jgi:hypothetical protein